MSQVYEWLRILELEPGATFDDIRRAHRDMAKVWHPDRFTNDRRLLEKAEQHQKRINEAFNNLEQWVRAGRPLPMAHGGIASGGPLTAGVPGASPPVHKRHPLRDTWSIRQPLGFQSGYKRAPRRRASSRRWYIAIAVLAGVVTALFLGALLG